MDGCLGWMLRAVLIVVFFAAGGVLGYFYITGSFDSYLVEWEISRLEGITLDEALKRVIPDATLEQAYQDLSRVEQRFVLWSGELIDLRSLDNQLRILTINGGRSQFFLAFYQGEMENITIGEQVEIVGYVRQLLIQSGGQGAAQMPHVIAFRVEKAAIQVPDGNAT